MTQQDSKISVSQSLTKEQNDACENTVDHGSIVEMTKSCLTESLKCIQGIPQDFLSNECLSRPPFKFIYTLVKVFVEKLNFANGLYDTDELENIQTLSRQKKIRFIFKALVCVSLITNERVDIFVSPAKILSGQDVGATHFFLQCLSKAVSVAPEISRLKATEVIETGVNVIYKQSVKTRSTIVRIQANFRGRLTRLQLRKPIRVKSNDLNDDACLNVNPNDLQNVRKKISINDSEGIRLEEKEEGEIDSSSPRVVNEEQELSAHNNHKANKQLLTTTQQLNSKIDVTINTDSSTGDCDCQDESTYSIQETSSKNHGIEDKIYHDIYPFTKKKKKPSSLTTIPEKKVLKKLKIVNGVKKREIIVVQRDENDKKNNTTKSPEEEVDSLLSQLKLKMKRLQDKEDKLEEKIEATRQKEEHLQFSESRVSRLAISLRKKEEKLKQERIKQSIELDKIRLEFSDPSLRSNMEVEEAHEADNENLYEDLWKRACTNPTITDLRLKLEAKQNAMKKRQEKVMRLEKELRRKLVEVEEERKQLSDQKKALHESMRNTTRQKIKPHAIKSKKTMKEPTLKENDIQEIAEEIKDNGRRQAFHGEIAANPDILKRIAHMRNKRREKMNLSKKTGKRKIESTMTKQQSAFKALQDNGSFRKASVRAASKSPPLLRKRSDGNISPINHSTKNDVPRSLLRYSSIYKSTT
jgi:hypothetical protein